MKFLILCKAWNFLSENLRKNSQYKNAKENCRETLYNLMIHFVLTEKLLFLFEFIIFDINVSKLFTIVFVPEFYELSKNHQKLNKILGYQS